MTFEDCLMECAGNTDFVREYERITGKRFARAPIEVAVDKVTGNDMRLAGGFAAFVKVVVWDTFR